MAGLGRKLDAAIAEALGYEVGIRDGEIFTPDKNWTEGGCIECGYTGYVGNYDGNEVPYFSESGNAMLELDREMRERGWCIEISSWNNISTNPKGNGKSIFMANITMEFNQRTHFVLSNTMPLAAAKAAYKALTGKEWQERECLLS